MLRACAMTLVVVADAQEDAADSRRDAGVLMHDHPSRAIVVRVRDAEAPELEARVFAQCWMPFGQRRQICCEQIEISTLELSLADVPAVILPLVVADLPVILWCRPPRLLAQPRADRTVAHRHQDHHRQRRFPGFEGRSAAAGPGRLLRARVWAISPGRASRAGAS